jgi:hypothetical protein
MNTTNETPAMKTALIPEILTRRAAAEYLKICRTTLDRLDIPRTHVRRRVLYRRAVLDRWLAEHTEGAGQ